MKNKLTPFILIPILTLVGCDSESSSSQATAKSTAVIETTIDSTMTATDELIYMNRSDWQNFDSYEELMAAYTKGRSTNYIHPLPEIVDTWELISASLCPSNYRLNYKDTENQTKIMLEIDYTSTYNKISEYFDGIAYSYGASSIVEMTDRYAVEHYSEFDDYAILGITGEQNIMYTLVVNSDDETADPVALLKEYKDILEL